MPKEEYLALSAAKWEEMESLKAETALIKYENRFTKIWNNLYDTVLEHSISRVPNGRQKKN